jgi:hypothetical protein
VRSGSSSRADLAATIISSLDPAAGHPNCRVVEQRLPRERDDGLHDAIGEGLRTRFVVLVKDG